MVNATGTFALGQSRADRWDELESLLGSIGDACAKPGRDSECVLHGTTSVVRAGTIWLNTPLSRTGSQPPISKPLG